MGFKMRNKSNLKTPDERSISHKIHDSQLHYAKIFLSDSIEQPERLFWENRVEELQKEVYY